MERKVFLKNSLGFLGMAVTLPSLLKVNATETGFATNGDCTISPSETAGPFPTITPSSWVRGSIVDGRMGIPFTISINIMNKNANCTALQNAIVDIWHCDKDGNYSEYGGGGMQATNYTSVHFLRGRQTTDAQGMVGFTTIFPGWYSGRAPHIHVHVYDTSGRSLLVTQIALPKTVTDTVYSTSSYYSSRGKQDTTNENDNVFSDGYTNELA